MSVSLAAGKGAQNTYYVPGSEKGSLESSHTSSHLSRHILLSPIFTEEELVGREVQ